MARIYLSPPHMGADERNLLLEAFDSNWIAPLGPHVDAFERELGARIGVENVAALSSGTAGLHLALLVLGVGRNDDVMTSTFTFAASANAITYVGARPVFVDCDRTSWNMDPELLADEMDRRAKAGDLPKAMLIVDLYGQCGDWDRYLAIGMKHGVPIIEDAAEALGASYKGRPAGSFGVMSAFSFNGNKIITTGGGGALVSTNKKHVDSARFLATQARDPAPHYQHSSIGFNYRLSNLLAAVGRGQLRVLDERIRARRANREFYMQALGSCPGIRFIPDPPWGGSTSWLTCIVIEPTEFGVTSERVREALQAADIEARPVWKPMHLQPIFESCPSVGGEVSAQLFEKGLCLPSGSSLTREELERIVDVIRAQGTGV